MQDRVASDYVLYPDRPSRPVVDGIPLGATVLLDGDPGGAMGWMHVGKVVDARFHDDLVDIGFEGYEVWTVKADRAVTVVLAPAERDFYRETWLSKPRLRRRQLSGRV